MKKYIVIFSSVLLLLCLNIGASGTTPFYTETQGEYLVLLPDNKSNKALADGMGGIVYTDAQLINKAADTSIAGTGKFISVGNKKYEIIVVGDMDGDGLVLKSDLTKAKKAFGNLALTEKEKLILDADVNGRYTATDYIRLKCHSDGIKKIAENYEQPSVSPGEENSSPDSSEDSSVDPDWVNQCAVSLSDNGISIDGNGAAISGKTLNITKGGEYTVSGKISDGMIYVNSTEKVKIRLSGADISNNNGPAIFFANADKAYITVDNGTVNYLKDGTSYSNGKGTVFSEVDLEIKGKGTLYITANFKHAICCDNDLSIENGNIIVNSAQKDGIHAKKSVDITGGDVVIKNCLGDAIDCQGTSTGLKGTVSVSGGKLTVINTTGDAINALGDVVISAGNISLSCDMDGIKTDGYAKIQGSTVLEINAGSDGINSAKGIVVSAGTLNINSVDYTLKSDADISISGGVITLTDAREKIYALGNINVSGGTIK